MNRGISVIICCYNSSWIIGRTLEALKKQQFFSPVPFEVLLVDNRCTDDTVRIAEDTMKDSGIEFRVVKEDKPGLANARRKGINESKYEYVVYCDDDNLLCPNYVSTMVAFLDNMPKVGAIGGKGIAEFEIEPPKVVKDNLDCYAIGSQLEHKDWLFGAGLALRSAIVREVYTNQHCYLMGRKGEELLSGDDSELVKSILLRGYSIFATDEIWFTHVLKAERLTEEYYSRLYEGLIAPFPVYNVMNAVLYGHGFVEAIDEYLHYYKRIIKYSFLFWKSGSCRKRHDAIEKLKHFRYWGVFQLYKIYHQWMRIKQSEGFTN